MGRECNIVVSQENMVGVFQKLSGLLRFKNIGSTSKAKTVKLIGKFQPCLMSFTPRVYINWGITKFLDHSGVWSKVSFRYLKTLSIKFQKVPEFFVLVAF